MKVKDRAIHLRSMMLFMYIIVINFAIGISSLITYMTVSDYLRTMTISHLGERTSFLQQQLDQLVDRFESISDGILGNARLHKTIMTKDDISEDELEWIFSYIESITFNEYIENVMIIDFDGNVYDTGQIFTPVYVRRDKSYTNTILEIAKDSDGSNEWIKLRENIFDRDTSDREEIYLFRKLRYLDAPWLTAGYSILQIDSRAFLSLIVPLQLNEGKSFIQVIHKDGSIYYSSNKNRDTSLYLDLLKSSNIYSGVYHENNEKYFLSFHSSTDSDFTLVDWQPYHVVDESLQPIKYIFLYTLIPMTLGLFILGYLFSLYLSKPIEELANTMDVFSSGNRTITARVFGFSEVTMLQRQFNTMSHRINTLMGKIEEDMEEKRLLELRMLRYQINPHFLYNFLDSLNWLSLEANEKRMSTLITALARFIRIGLMENREVVTVEKEIEYSNYYISMLQFRFGDSFTYSFEIDSAIKAKMIVRMGLQPIIENAIMHGIKPRNNGNGYILIKGSLHEGKSVISVTDNGMGIDPEKLISLNKKLKNPPALSSSDEAISNIGLVNVCRRIKLHFGVDYGIVIVSDGIGQGSCVKLYLPG